MTDPQKQNLTHELIQHARRSRDPLRLAMALRVNYPTWGSQAWLVALGLSGYLHVTNWNFTNLDENFVRWREEAELHLDPQMLLLRGTQIQALSDMLQRPRELYLGASPQALQGQPHLVLGLINHGLLYQDVLDMAQGKGGPDTWGESLSGVHPRSYLAELMQHHGPQLSGVSLSDYINAVDMPQRRWHPNVLLHDLMKYQQNLSGLTNPSMHGARLDPLVWHRQEAEAPLLGPHLKRVRA